MSETSKINKNVCDTAMFELKISNPIIIAITKDILSKFRIENCQWSDRFRASKSRKKKPNAKMFASLSIVTITTPLFE